MDSNTAHDALKYGLESASAVQNPADVHGTLTGILCIDNEASVIGALDDEPTDALREALDALRHMTLEGLFDPDLSFEPLLPDDETDLHTRVEALARWCSGFLYGLSSQQDGASELDLSHLSADVREVINDLSQLSRAGLTTEDEDAEAAEADYAELVEYVRVGVQMIFLEMRPPREGRTTRESLH